MLVNLFGKNPTTTPPTSTTDAPSVQLATPPPPVLNKKIKLILNNPLCPGDVVVSSSCLRDLHLAYPGVFQTDMRSACPAIFEHNPYITPILDTDPDAIKIKMEYNLVHKSNQSAYHFMHGYIQDLEQQLNKLGITHNNSPIKITPTAFRPDLYIGANEQKWVNQFQEVTGKEEPYWVFICGHKSDFTAKAWNPFKMHEVIEACPDINFVQVGEDHPSHTHYAMDDLPNVTNLIGKTDLRQLIRLIWNSAGVICPVTSIMHIAAGLPAHPSGPSRKPCIVTAGAREPAQWEAYPDHRFISTTGILKCDGHTHNRSGGCWVSRTVALGDNDSKDKSLCKYPVEIYNDGSTKINIPKCQELITSEEIVLHIRNYMKFYTDN